MSGKPAQVNETPEWKALETHHTSIGKLSLSSLFAKDSARFEKFSIRNAYLLLDYSKNLITTETIDLLLALAEKCQLQQAVADMFSGAAINNTEDQPALHVALRSREVNTVQEQSAHETLNKMELFVNSVLEGQWTGYTGLPLTDVVNIGIGGSDLGPAMAYRALTPYHRENINCYFISNVDPCHLTQTLSALDPASTLFIVASKSFTTLETSKNAESARHWLLDRANDETALAKHFVAVTANVKKAQEFGLDETNIFPVWDWVGGRFSLWSAIGLPVALGIGMDNFRALLNGANTMDQHFKLAPLRENIPVLMALLNIWALNFFKAETQVILPYAQNLSLFPAFLQQLDMESLGKSVRKDGSPVALDIGSTGGIVWGSTGTNGQHSFHQLLHQGTHLIPADFIAVAKSHYDEESLQHEESHQHLLANCISQSQALMEGKSLEKAKEELKAAGMDETKIEELAPHKVIAGNKPSNTIMIEKLTPETLGSLIAAYEHKVYVQSVILQINAFDQWGVELGKTLSNELVQALRDDRETTEYDSSTNGLINFYKSKVSE